MKSQLIDLLWLALAACIIGTTIIYAAMTGRLFDDARERALQQGQVQDRDFGAQATARDQAQASSSVASPGQD